MSSTLFFKQILEGVLEKSFDTHFKIVILPSNYDEALEIKYLEQFRKKAFEAMIFTSTQVSEERLMTYQKYGPLVLCHKPAHADIPAIYTERRLGYEAAFAWMKMQGVKSIGFLFARAKSPTTSVTISAYEKIFGQKVRKEQMLTGAISDEDGYALAPEVGQFDGIFANSDNIAAGLWLWYEERGLKKSHSLLVRKNYWRVNYSIYRQLIIIIWNLVKRLFNSLFRKKLNKFRSIPIFIRHVQQLKSSIIKRFLRFFL